MRAQDYDHDGPGYLRPRSSRLDVPGAGPAAHAAAEGRWDIVGTDGLLGLQRSAGNQGVVAAMQDEQTSPVYDVVSSGGGQPLDSTVRFDMEARLGHDFGDVRVHHDARADESARAVNAHAYTVGSNIVFQRDQYDPSSDEGRLTLAHELTHVIQQRTGPVDGTPAPGGIRVSDPSDRFEREAAANASRAMSAPAPAAATAVTAGLRKAAAVQRQRDEQEEEASATVQGTFVQLLGDQRGRRPDKAEAGVAVRRQVTGAPLPLQRDDPDTASAAGQTADTDSGAGQGADAGQAPAQMVKIVTNEGEQEVSKPQALAYLQNKIEWSSNKIDLMAGENAMLKQQRTDILLDSAMGWVSDVIGGFLSMPDPSMWDQPKASIAAARAAVSAGDPGAAGTALKAANEAYKECEEAYLTYKDGNLSGADNTITVLKDVIAVDAFVGTLASGFTTIGAVGALTGEAATVGASGLVTQAAVAGAVKAEGEALTDLGDQAATSKPWNWAELLEKTGGGFTAGFLAALVSGPLKEMLSESCSGYVSEELMSDADVADIAKSLGVETLERNFLQSTLKKFILEYVTDQAGDWLMGKPIDMVIEAMTKSAQEGAAPPDQASAVNIVARYAAPVIAAAFKASL
jgi:Domain of unknown function (DUF4157)